jgi:hypothetical protein
MIDRTNINDRLKDGLAVKESDIRSVQRIIGKIYDYKNVTLNEVEMVREMLSEELADDVLALVTSNSYLMNNQVNAKTKRT